jgi:hypothetical protein
MARMGFGVESIAWSSRYYLVKGPGILSLSNIKIVAGYMAELKLRHNLKFGRISLFDLKVGQKQPALHCRNMLQWVW